MIRAPIDEGLINFLTGGVGTLFDGNGSFEHHEESRRTTNRGEDKKIEVSTRLIKK